MVDLKKFFAAENDDTVLFLIVIFKKVIFLASGLLPESGIAPINIHPNNDIQTYHAVENSLLEIQYHGCAKVGQFTKVSLLLSLVTFKFGSDMSVELAACLEWDNLLNHANLYKFQIINNDVCQGWA